jgi:hypothetical protein
LVYGRAARSAAEAECIAAIEVNAAVAIALNVEARMGAPVQMIKSNNRATITANRNAMAALLAPRGILHAYVVN